MNTASWAALVAAFLSPLIAYLGAYRRFSGKISSSAAEELWVESRAIRADLQVRNSFLSDKIASLEQRIDELEERNRQLYLENGELTRSVEAHERTIRALTDEVHELRVENGRLREENIRMKKRVKELEKHNAQ